MDFSNSTITDFMDRVMSVDPVPGGGSVSALCGALAASLGCMVARLTAGRKKYADVEAEMLDVIDTLTPQVEALTDDIDRDSHAYAAVMAAFKLPKETDDERRVRAGAIQDATRQAAIVPLEVARRVTDIFPYIALVATKGNTNAITDAAVAAMAARTAILGALLNVKINLGSITDADFVASTAAEVTTLEARAIEMEKQVLEIANAKI